MTSGLRAGDTSYRALLDVPRFARLAAATIGVALGCAILLGASSLPLVIASVVLVGAAQGGLDVALFSLRQRVTDPAWFGRAFAVWMHLNSSGLPVGSALSGPLLAVSLPFALGAAVAFAAAAITFGLVPLSARPGTIRPPSPRH